MSSTVYILRTNRESLIKAAGDNIAFLFKKSNLSSLIEKNDFVALKIHFGEKGNDTHISPELIRPIINEIKKKDAKPFLTDTCVLYKSNRDNGVDHLLLAHDHGFTIERVGAPVIIADGLIGRMETNVKIDGQIFKSVAISPIALEANTMIVISHVTGHMATGIGGAIKNIGMGLASRRGKLRQHSLTKPAINRKKCTGCGICLKYCPEDAIYMKEEKALIDSKKCIGCGECLTVCRHGGVKFDWKMEENHLQKMMAEHALGVTVEKRGKIGFINFIVSVTKDCDCLGKKQKPIIDDIGVLASTDPVAIDAASLDLIKEAAGRPLSELTYPNIDPWTQIRHGEKIGLGEQHYRLIEI